VSELRKGSDCHPNVASWFSEIRNEELFLSVLTIGEIRKGIELIRRRDAAAAGVLEAWLRELVEGNSARILLIDRGVAEEWGRMNVPDPLPVIDGLLAATASIHDLTLATRNVKDVARTGIRCIDPFQPRS
jgi:predicted nucleic acid-binding protein